MSRIIKDFEDVLMYILFYFNNSIKFLTLIFKSVKSLLILQNVILCLV